MLTLTAQRLGARGACSALVNCRGKIAQSVHVLQFRSFASRSRKTAHPRRLADLALLEKEALRLDTPRRVNPPAPAPAEPKLSPDAVRGLHMLDRFESRQAQIGGNAVRCHCVPFAISRPKSREIAWNRHPPHPAGF